MASAGSEWLSAAKAGDLSALQRLLAARPELLHFTGSGTPDAVVGSTALHWAASKGHDACVAFLLAQGADVHARNNGDSSPLHCAALSNRLGSAAALTHHGADPKLEDEFGDIMGLCFGAWEEASQDVHTLVDILARARLKFQVLSEGRPDGGSDQELAMVVAQIRRLLSVVAIKAQVGCLLGRLHQVGPGNKQLAKKREWAVRQDEKMRRERHSQWIRKIEGVNTLRKGMIKIA